MAFLTLEDLLGTVEVVVFAYTYNKCKHYLEEGKKVFVIGNSSVESSGEAKILASTVVPFEEMGMDLWIAFKDMEQYNELEEQVVNTILEEHGKDNILFYIAKEKKTKKLNFRTHATPEMLEKLKDILGEKMVILK